ncbi:MAG TPA: zinc ribbon domain-containing protein [Armatimonadota bacterium]|nr:zinc ribbon domain-containing protein [Armatimonadota bacterium]
MSCGSCRCVLTADIKKGRYIYYHCTDYKSMCSEKYVRDMELARQFGEALCAIQLNEEAYALIVRAFKASQRNQRKFHMKVITRLPSECMRLQQHIDTFYEGKLDVRIGEEFSDRKYQEWRDEQQTM